MLRFELRSTRSSVNTLTIRRRVLRKIHRVFLGILVKNCVAGMLLTCAIEMELKKAGYAKHCTMTPALTNNSFVFTETTRGDMTG